MAEQTGTSVFDMDSLTVTQTQRSPFALSKVPGINQGAGTGSHIDTKLFLSDCPGTDTKLVHGLRRQIITGDMYEKIDGFCKTSIYGGEDHYVMPEQKVTVQGTLQQTIAGSVTSMVVGAYTGTQMGPCTISYVAPMTEIHASNKHIEEPWEYKNEWAELKIVKLVEVVLIPGLKLEAISAKIGVAGIKTDVYALHGVSKGIGSMLSFLESGGHFLEAKLGIRVKAQPTANAAPEVATLCP